MKNRKFYVRFVIEKSRSNKSGKCPIRCRVTLDGERKVFSTGEFVKPVHWNAKQQKVLDKDTEFTTVNIKLELIREKIKSIFLSLQLSSEEFDLECNS